MPISRIIVDNYMKVTHADLEPVAGVNEITGSNGAGKSSFLNAIATMGGKRHVAWKPIHDGAEEARIEIHLDGVGEVPIRMVRSMKRTEDGDITPSLVLEGPGGGRLAKPQEILNSLVSEFAFDPLSILSMEKDKLQKVLQRFVPDFDFDADKAKLDADFDQRTSVNSQIKDLKSQVAGIAVPDGTPEEPINEDELLAELNGIAAFNADIEGRRQRRAAVAAEAKSFRDQATSYDQQADDYLRLAKEATEKAEELRSKADANDKRLAEAEELPALKDSAEVTARISKARAVNAHVAGLKRRNALVDKVKRAAEQAAELTNRIEERRAARALAIRNAKMPMDNLSFDDDGTIVFEGQPLEQASQAQKIRVSVAIAAALSPKLKVAIVKDGSLLDKKSWALLEQEAEARGLQIFIESVESNRPTAIVIEDGRMLEQTPAIAAE